MAKRICKLADKSLRETVDLRDYKDIIIDTINEIAPNKNPIVEKEYFSTDVLTHSEAVKIGFALATKPAIVELGIVKTILRLFDGHVVKDKEDKKERHNDNNNKKVPHGGRYSKTVLANQ